MDLFSVKEENPPIDFESRKQISYKYTSTNLDKKEKKREKGKTMRTHWKSYLGFMSWKAVVNLERRCFVEFPGSILFHSVSCS